MTVGPIIGSGIFISPKGILQNAGGSVGWALVMWVACGVSATLGALSLAELGTMFRKSGGTFVYILTAYNQFVAFTQVYCFIMIVRPASNAIVSIIMAEYLLAPVFPDCESKIPESAIKLLAIFALSKYILHYLYQPSINHFILLILFFPIC